MNEKEYEKVDEIFKNILNKYPNISLWENYLNYKKEKLIPIEFRKLLINEQKKRVSEMIECYEQAKNKVGFCVNSYSIWNNYIEFIDHLIKIKFYIEQEGVKILREIYQEAIKNPIGDIDTIWKSYEQFEKKYKSNTTEKILNEEKTIYTKTLAMYNLLIIRYQSKKDIWNSILNDHVLPCPPRGTPSEKEQLTLWRKAIEYINLYL